MTLIFAMAAIVSAVFTCDKRETKDVAFESGRIVVLPSPVDVRGPLAEYSVVVSPPRPVTLHVTVNLVDGGKRSAWRMSSVTIAREPGEGVSYGTVRVSTAHLVVADVATLYCAGNGVMWHRQNEAMRAIRACSMNRRTGGRFTSDWGEPAVALRLGRGPFWGQASVSQDRVRIDVTAPNAQA